MTTTIKLTEQQIDRAIAEAKKCASLLAKELAKGEYGDVIFAAQCKESYDYNMSLIRTGEISK